nr:aminoglycoside phosphotransferase family protein [Pseudonocardia acidicola]
MPHLGITAVGLAWLIGQCVVAGCILIATAPWLPGLLGTRIDAVRSAALLRRVGPAAVRGAGVDDPGSWVLRERLVGRSDSVVVGIGPEDGPGALLKAADSAKGQVQLRRQTEMLAAMHADERLGAWRALIPTIVGAGDIGGSYCVMESRMPGEGGGHSLRDPARRRFFLSSSIATISELHRLSATPVRAGDRELERWVHGPMATVRGALPRGQQAAATMLENELADRVRGRLIAAAWTHGDFTADNVLTDADGRVTAVVDWCHADDHGLPVLDVVCLLLTAENLTDGTELGTLVLRRLADALPVEHHLLARAQRMLGGEVLDVGLLTLLGWLQHVNHNIVKSPTFAANPVWMRRNVIAVVRGAAFRNPGRELLEQSVAPHDGFLLS